MRKKPLKEINVIVADDNDLNLDQSEELLIKLGIDIDNIFRAHNGENVIKILNTKEKGEIDLILCDWKMPRGTGIKVLTNLRKMENHAEVPFIMVTNEDERAAIIKALKLNATDYILKPIDEDIFREKIYKAIGIIVK